MNQEESGHLLFISIMKLKMSLPKHQMGVKSAYKQGQHGYIYIYA